MENEQKTRKEYVLAQEAKDQKFDTVVLNKKTKFSQYFVLGVKFPNGYVKECKIADDERGLVVLNGTHKTYVANFCEGVSNESGAAYFGLDIWLDDGYYKREWLTPAEKVMLAKLGLLEVR
jgi:hypothetical protein